MNDRPALPPPASPPPVSEGEFERAGRVLAVPMIVAVSGILGTIALLWGLVAAVQPARVPARPTASIIDYPAVRLDDPSLRHAPLATSITPITSLSVAASGMPYSGQAYEVRCTVSGAVTLYPVVHNGTAWEGPYQSYGCALDSTVSTQGTCVFPARQGTGLVWNAFKTGSGSVSGCTAEGRAGTVPASRTAAPTGTAGGDLSGSYPNPVVDGIQGRAVASTAPANGQILWWVASVSQWQPTTLSGVSPGGSAGGDLGGTYPDPTVDGIQGRSVASTAPANGQVLWWVSANNQWEPTTLSGISPGGSAGGDLTGTYPSPIVAGLRGRTVSSIAPANGQVLWWVAAANEWQPTTLATGTGTVTSVGLSMPSIFSVSGSPVTDSGTISVSLATQAANVVFAGPSSGADAAPTFRTLVEADIPDLAASKITSGQIAKARGGTGEDNSTGGTANTVWARPNGSTGAASYRALVADDLPTGIQATKIGDGSVSDTEFGYLNGVTSAIQTQFDNITTPLSSPTWEGGAQAGAGAIVSTTDLGRGFYLVAVTTGNMPQAGELFKVTHSSSGRRPAGVFPGDSTTAGNMGGGVHAFYDNAGSSATVSSFRWEGSQPSSNTTYTFLVSF